MNLKCYCNSSWCGEFSCAPYGVLISYLLCPILWIAHRQQMVAASTCHAEYMALGVGTRNCLWVINLLEDCLGYREVGNILCDNKLAIKVLSNDSSNKRTRHSDREFFITKNTLRCGNTRITWVPSNAQVADIFTKPFRREILTKMRRAIMPQ